MFDIDSLSKRFISGDLDRIFICIYSYFVVGYIILFTVFEQNFIGLELFTQVLLSIGISFPITTYSIFILNRNKTLDETKGLFCQSIGEMGYVSFSYSTFFSIFYIAKHFTNYDTNFDPVIALVIIILNFVLFWVHEKRR